MSFSGEFRGRPRARSNFPSKNGEKEEACIFSKFQENSGLAISGLAANFHPRMEKRKKLAFSLNFRKRRLL